MIDTKKIKKCQKTATLNTKHVLIQIFFRYLATGTTMSDLQYQYRLAKSAISVIARQVCQAICVNIMNLCFPELTEKMWMEKAAEFYDRSNFPHCIGAIDDKHIRVIKPEHSGSLYYNYKNFFSILLIGICDASYKFLYVDISAYGKSSDSTIF